MIREMAMLIKTFGPYEQRAYEQLVRCAEAGDASFAVLCADNHVGYSHPIGGTIAYLGRISPSGVGYDIGCGNRATKTNLKASDISVPAAMDEIVRTISFGIGRSNQESAEHPVLDNIREADFAPQRTLLDLAANQLGTVGSGNHYIDLFEDEKGSLWVGVHFGSRGFGHRTATGFLALAQGRSFTDRAKDGEMDSPPVLFDVDSELGQAYISAMTLAGEYAYAGRDWVVGRVLKILGAQAVETIHNHHNFAWQETHFGETFWVVRKGCTPAFPGQQGFVGGSMGDNALIIEGVDSEASRESLYSTIHGAGRVMSRTQAAGKVKWKMDANWKKRPVRTGGKVNFDQVKRVLASQGIVLRGGGADEAPEVYKRLHEVVEEHAGTVRVLHTLKPLGVAMAGSDIEDPYKD